MNFLVLRNSIELKKTTSKIFPYQATCCYVIDGKLHNVVEYGRTKQAVSIDVIDKAYKLIINELQPQKNKLQLCFKSV